ncbi:Cyclic nucleotide-binding domain protein [compost metagenome]
MCQYMNRTFERHITRNERKLPTMLSDEVGEMIDREEKIVLFPAGDTVLREGDTASYQYYITKGVVRGYYIDRKVMNITKCFCAEDDFFRQKDIEYLHLQHLQ